MDIATNEEQSRIRTFPVFHKLSRRWKVSLDIRVSNFNIWALQQAANAFMEKAAIHEGF